MERSHFSMWESIQELCHTSNLSRALARFMSLPVSVEEFYHLYHSAFTVYTSALVTTTVCSGKLTSFPPFCWRKSWLLLALIGSSFSSLVEVRAWPRGPKLSSAGNLPRRTTFSRMCLFCDTPLGFSWPPKSPAWDLPASYSFRFCSNKDFIV